MPQHAVIYLICAFGLIPKACTSLITGNGNTAADYGGDAHYRCAVANPAGPPTVTETQQTVMAAVGDKVCFSCQLVQPKDAVQMKWQMVLPDGVKNLAFSHQDFAGQVNPDFRDKMEFKEAGLQNSSIVIKNVMEEDEGCYDCVFDAHPDGVLIARTCLQVYELHEPVVHVRESESPEEAVVSCSATGRPAPTVTLTVPHYNSTSVTNTNATATVTATAVLPRLRGNSTQVGCAVRVLSGPQIEVFTMIPELTLSSDDGPTWKFVSAMVVAYVCVAVVIIIWPKINTIMPVCVTETEKNKNQEKKEQRTAQGHHPHQEEDPCLNDEQQL